MPPVNDTRYPHLHLIHEEPNPERRKRSFGSPPPDRGGRESFGATFAMQVGRLEEQARQRPKPMEGIKPHLVFRVPVVQNAPVNEIVTGLQDIDVDIVSIEPNNAIIAFQDDDSLSNFKQAIQGYQQGPRPGINPQTNQPYASTSWDFLAYIEPEQMSLFSREDRIGSRLAQEIGADGTEIDPNRLYTFDVEVWHRGNAAKARESLEELSVLINDQNARSSPLQPERIWDTFTGESLCIARVTVTGTKLDRLLDMDGIAEVDLPPIAEFNEIAAIQATPQNFPAPPAPPENGPCLCVVDTGITAGHPLLKANVGHEEALLTKSNSPVDGNGHGTLVGGLAVFGNIRGCFTNGKFSSPITLYSARVLNDQNEFDDEQLIYNQIKKAVEAFAKPPYNCRVFNMSLGTPAPAVTDGGKRQTQWAAVLDELAREMKVLLVVSAGNNRSIFTNNAAKAEKIKQDYPTYLFDPNASLCDPATAAIPLTVGSLAEHDSVTPKLSNIGNDLALPIAGKQEPSPFTRIGPGINGAIKPEFVAFGGNVVFSGVGPMRRISSSSNAGTAVMSFSREPLSRLFDYDMGTSFAAPHVSRLAALLWHRLRDQRKEDPHPNLVRAVLATAASVPEAARHAIEPHGGEQRVVQVCGYGLIDEEDALDSRDNRVTLCTQGSIVLDTFKIYEVPIPDEFRNDPDHKTITVALAFDPPVRRRRQDYLGVTMQVCLIRGKTPEEIAAAYRAVSKANRPNVPGAIGVPYRCDLQPGTARLATSTLQRSTWRFRDSKAEYGSSYYLVVWAMRKWAPAEIVQQDFAVAVTLEAKNEARLYKLVRARVQQRLQARVRV